MNTKKILKNIALKGLILTAIVITSPLFLAACNKIIPGTSG